jgi:hypothetical protein
MPSLAVAVVVAPAVHMKPPISKATFILVAVAVAVA